MKRLDKDTAYLICYPICLVGITLLREYILNAIIVIFGLLTAFFTSIWGIIVSIPLGVWLLLLILK